MRLTDAEKEPFYKMREVSELRTQFQCEYRLHLRQRIGDSHSIASVTGTDLHRRVSVKSDRQQTMKTKNRLVPLLIVIVALIAGLLWILW
ncbi:MAG: hypothetical protein PVJ05_04980 [Candidatus Thorarchaeota archaeon]